MLEPTGYAFGTKLPDAFFNRGNVRAAKGDMPGAAADYTRAIELDPGHAEAHCNRGNARSRLGDPDAAIADSSRAIELDGKYVDAYYNRGSLRLSRGQAALAVPDLEAALRLAAPDWSLRERAEALLRDTRASHP